MNGCCRAGLVGLLLLLLPWIMPGAATGQAPEFNPRRVVNREFAAITDFPVVAASRAGLQDSELVLGVEIDGHARAYPINMLTGPQREILNDRLGGRAIAATW